MHGHLKSFIIFVFPSSFLHLIFFPPPPSFTSTTISVIILVAVVTAVIFSLLHEDCVRCVLVITHNVQS